MIWLFGICFFILFLLGLLIMLPWIMRKLGEALDAFMKED